MLDWNNEYKITPWIPCYPLTAAGIFKSFSWPPSVAAGLKRDIGNDGKNVKPLQIPPPKILLCVCPSDLWHCRYLRLQAQSNGKLVPDLAWG